MDDVPRTGASFRKVILGKEAERFAWEGRCKTKVNKEVGSLLDEVDIYDWTHRSSGTSPCQSSPGRTPFRNTEGTD